MLNTATTKQFRSTVRAVCASKNISLGDSWTNGAPGPFNGKRYDSGDRTVGFVCYAANARLAEMIEQELKKQGVTAETRATDAAENKDAFGYERGGCYIRGTCILG